MIIALEKKRVNSEVKTMKSIKYIFTQSTEFICVGIHCFSALLSVFGKKLTALFFQPWIELFSELPLVL